VIEALRSAFVRYVSISGRVCHVLEPENAVVEDGQEESAASLWQRSFQVITVRCGAFPAPCVSLVLWDADVAQFSLGDDVWGVGTLSVLVPPSLPEAYALRFADVSRCAKDEVLVANYWCDMSSAMRVRRGPARALTDKAGSAWPWMARSVLTCEGCHVDDWAISLALVDGVIDGLCIPTRHRLRKLVLFSLLSLVGASRSDWGVAGEHRVSLHLHALTEDAGAVRTLRALAASALRATTLVVPRRSADLELVDRRELVLLVQPEAMCGSRGALEAAIERARTASGLTVWVADACEAGGKARDSLLDLVWVCAEPEERAALDAAEADALLDGVWVDESASVSASRIGALRATASEAGWLAQHLARVARLRCDGMEPAARALLQRFFLLRKRAGDYRAAQLQTLVRLAESHALLHGRERAELSDAAAAVVLAEESQLCRGARAARDDACETRSPLGLRLWPRDELGVERGFQGHSSEERFLLLLRALRRALGE
jgi:hypothetical protein